MKKLIVFLLALGFILLAVSNSTTTSTYTLNPPAGMTSAPGENNCTSCHNSFALNSGIGIPSITVSELGLPVSSYTPGNTYQVVVGITEPGISKFGFQVVVLEDAGNTNVGNILLTDDVNTTSQMSAGRTYLNHSYVGASVNTWGFDWIAPTAGTGSITIYAVFNSTDSMFNTAGDYVYAHSLTMPEAGGPVCSESQTLNVPQVTGDRALLQWTSVDSAVTYSIRGQVVGDTGYSMVTVLGSDTSRIVTALLPGKDYRWQVMTTCDSIGSLSSPWSVADTFATLCAPPDSLATINISDTSATATWQTVPDVLGYQILAKEALNPSITLILVPGADSMSIHRADLIPNTQYDWRIRSFCDSLTTSGWSPTKSFTSLGPAPKRAETPGVGTVRVYPNPTSGLLHIQPPDLQMSRSEVSIYNMLGSRVYHLEIDPDETVPVETIRVHLAHSGAYFVSLTSAGETVIEKIIVR